MTYFAYNKVLILALLTVGLFVSTGISYANEQSYSPTLHPDEQNSEVKKALIIHSLPDGAYNYQYLVEIDYLTQILSSHWNVTFQTSPYEEVDVSKTNDFTHIILIEANAETEAIARYRDIVDNSQAKVMWLGCGASTYALGTDTRVTNDEIKQVQYKNVSFATGGSLNLCGELPLASDNEVLATYQKNNGDYIPLFVKTENGRILSPMNIPSYYSISNVSLVFLDIFHHLLGHHDNEDQIKPALLRLEDVNVHTYRNGRVLRRVYHHLKQRDIPFHIAFIEYYKDPSKNIEMHSYESRKFLFTIQKMLAEHDVTLIQHGYTHQFANEVSGVGFEFWDNKYNSHIEFEDYDEAGKYTEDKILSAQKAMQDAGLPVPDIWETPHYALSPLDSHIVSRYYKLRYEHIPYVGSLPFVAKIDGVVYIPENLGYIQESRKEIKEKILLLKQLQAFEDPVASVFWHPWRDVSEIKEMTKVIEDEGFTFVSAYSLVEFTEAEAVATATPVASIKPNHFSNLAKDTLIYFVFFSFVFGAIFYAINVYRVKKYIRGVRNFKLPMWQLLEFATQKNKDLPKLALFVPARNEGLVIANTIRRISNLDYPKNKLTAYIIVDERELDDDVERTTKDVAYETISQLDTSYPDDFIKIVEVPKWYSGVFGSYKHTFAKSTKGRALNYCLQTEDLNHIEMIGILDADGRLHPDVLKEVAYRRIEKHSVILQGPVFQVSNFKNVSIVGRAAGLELALHHLTELPHRLNKKGALQFLAGTNYFIDTECISEAGGWNQDALVEDAEIALRLYLKKNIVGDWLNCPELEQTPANFTIYCKQRERWVRGHLDLLQQVRKTNLPLSDKIHLYNKVILSQFRFVFDISLPIVSIYLMIAGSYSYLHPVFAYVSILLFVASIFIWDTYGFMYRALSEHIDEKMTISHKIKRSVQHLLFLPVFIVIQAIPRFQALYNYFFRKNKNMWYKTERTAEAVTN